MLLKTEINGHSVVIENVTLIGEYIDEPTGKEFPYIYKAEGYYEQCKNIKMTDEDIEYLNDYCFDEIWEALKSVWC